MMPRVNLAAQAATAATQDIEVVLLYAAYERKRLNVLMTLVSTFVVGSLLWLIFPQQLLLAWAAAILGSAVVGFVECRAFQRAAPALQDIARWQRLFIVQMGVSGAAWSVGPTWLMAQANPAQGPELALLISILFCVCAVAMASAAEQQSAMQAFLSAALAPPAIASLWQGGRTEQLVAVVLLFGLATLIMVGRDSNKAVRILLDTQARLSAILNASQDAVVGMTANWVVTDWNARAEAIFGRTPGEAKGRAFDTLLIPEKHRSAYRASMQQFLATGNEQGMNQRIETLALRRNGQEFPVEISVAAIKSKQGWHFTTFIADISERKAAEERLALFRQVFDASNQCVGIADGHGLMQYQNSTLAQELGYSDAELIGLPFRRLMPQASAATFAEQITQAVEAGQGWAGLLPHRRKNGSFFTSLSHIGVVKDKLGQVKFIFNIFTDFSPELARRHELASAKEAAESANRAKSDFLSSMSHELRTPMNAIIGFAQMLEYDDDLNADQQDSTAEILKAGRHLLALINDVLDLAKIDSGQVSLSLESIPLAALVEDCRQLMQPLATARQIALRFEVSRDAEVWADRVRLKQVLLNLLSNAVKYNRVGGQIHLRLQAMALQHDQSQARLRVRVTDTGEGIAADRMEELFQPFKRLGAEHGAIEGTGIGLTITRHLMNLMGGEVGVESQAGVGSTFWIELQTQR